MPLHLQTLELTADDPRRVFTRPAQDGINGGRPTTYRVARISLYDDGQVWIWAAQLTRAGIPYRSGMGLTLGTEARLAEIYGQDVADVVADALREAEAAAVIDGTDEALDRAALLHEVVGRIDAARVAPCVDATDETAVTQPRYDAVVRLVNDPTETLGRVHATRGRHLGTELRPYEVLVRWDNGAAQVVDFRRLVVVPAARPVVPGVSPRHATVVTSVDAVAQCPAGHIAPTTDGGTCAECEQSLPDDDDRWFVDSMGRDHDLAAVPTFDLRDPAQLVVAFARRDGYVYLLDADHRPVAVDLPADPDDPASVRASMAWLLSQAWER